MVGELKPVCALLLADWRSHSQGFSVSGELHPFSAGKHAGEQGVEADVDVRDQELW